MQKNTMSEEYIMNKKCFLICPIGKNGSDCRKHSDRLLNLLEKALLPIHYSVIRADKINDLGHITSQIINEILQADFVIADITGLNANVFYELAIRDCAKKACMIIYDKNQMEASNIPFDVNSERAFYYDLSDADYWTEFQSKLIEQIQKVQQPDFFCTNIVTIALNSPDYFSLELKKYDTTLNMLSDNLNRVESIINDKINMISSKIGTLIPSELLKK